MRPLLGGCVTITDSGSDRLIATIDTDRQDEVFAGHYPGFPLVPGMYLLDLVTRLVRRHRGVAGDGSPAVAVVSSARFRGAVRPGDVVTVRCDIPAGTDAPVRAECRTERGVVATFGLRSTVVPQAAHHGVSTEEAA